MADKTEAHRQADEREAKAAWMNEELEKRVPHSTKPAPKAAPAAKKT